MEPKNLRVTAEVIGIFAIVASLIFLGIQVQQSQEIGHGQPALFGRS